MKKGLTSLLVAALLTGCAHVPLTKPLPEPEKSSIVAQHELLWSGVSDPKNSQYIYRSNENFEVFQHEYFGYLNEGEYILPPLLFDNCTGCQNCEIEAFEIYKKIREEVQRSFEQ